MPVISTPRLEMIRAAGPAPVSVSNFSKAVFKCRLAASDASFNSGKCTISLFEAIRDGNAIAPTRIASKVVNIQDGTNQEVMAEFPRNNDNFPGPSLFPHSYYAVLEVRKPQARRGQEFAVTPIKVLSGAPLLIV